MMHRSGPVTLGMPEDDGKLLEIGCLVCRRHVYVPPMSLGIPLGQPVPTLAKRLRCSRCGAKNTASTAPMWARADARVPGGVNGDG